VRGASASPPGRGRQFRGLDRDVGEFKRHTGPEKQRGHVHRVGLGHIHGPLFRAENPVGNDVEGVALAGHVHFGHGSP